MTTLRLLKKWLLLVWWTLISWVLQQERFSLICVLRGFLNALNQRGFATNEFSEGGTPSFYCYYTPSRFTIDQLPGSICALVLLLVVSPSMKRKLDFWSISRETLSTLILRFTNLTNQTIMIQWIRNKQLKNLQHKLLRLPEVKATTGLSKSSIYARI